MEIISPLPVAWPYFLYFMWNEEQGEKRILVTRAPEWYLGKMNHVILCHPLRVFNISSGKQKKLYKGSQGEDGTLIKVSCFLFFLFQFFSASLNAAQGQENEIQI